MINRSLILLLWVLIIASEYAHAQIDSSFVEPEFVPTDQIEDFLQSTESTEFDLNTLYENLEYYQKNPLNLNEVGEEDLFEFGVLSSNQILNFIQYREQFGDLISIYELQAIPGFDLETIQQILPFVDVKKEVDQFQNSLGEMFTKGENDLFLRWSRVLETQQGFAENKFLGDRNKFYFRFRHNHFNKMSFGITAEKDAGEEFFKGSNKQGFDFYSAHIFLRDFSKTIKALALGDFHVNFGQGLILYTDFATGKSSYVNSVRRVSRVLKQYTSVNEYNFLRGVGTTLKVSDNVNFTIFGSSKKRDGNRVLEEIEEGLFEIVDFTSLQTSGLHRTIQEIEDEKSIRQSTIGSRIEWKDRKWQFAFNGLYNKLDFPLNRTPRLDNQFTFNGEELLNLSADYTFFLRNFNVFGETAYSDNGAFATLNGVLVSLDPKVDVSLVYRNFARDFHYLDARPFSDRRKTENEEGIYFGIEVKPRPNWKFSAFYDQWRNPWLRFGVDAPSKGREFRARLTYSQRRKMETYFEFRRKTREENRTDNQTNVDFLVPNSKFQTRFHLSYIINDFLEWRSRFDFIRFESGDTGKENGFMMYQDLKFRKVGFPFSFNARYALFDTDSFDTASYNYENDVIYFFSIPAYFARGNRVYFNIRYKGIRKMTIEGRIAQSFFSDGTTPGGGFDEILGNRRTEVRVQIRYKFGE